MRFDTKIAIAVREDLAVWQKLNVTAFLATGVAAGFTEIIGKPYEDGSGNEYLPLSRQPVVVLSGDAGSLTRCRERAVSRELGVAIYTEQMFATGNDDDNRAVVVTVPAGELVLAGIAMYGPRNAVDKSLKGLSLHR